MTEAVGETLSPKVDAPAFQIRVAANFTAEPLASSLRFWADRLGWPPESIVFSPYNQVFQQLLSAPSDGAAVAPGADLYLIRLEDWARAANPQEAHAIVERNAQDFARAILSRAEQSRRLLVVFLARPSSQATEEGQVWARLTSTLANQLRGSDRLLLLEHAELAEIYPGLAVEDPAANQAWHIPFADEYWTTLGTTLLRRMRPRLHPAHKVIVVDADNTLWDRVVAEVGTEQIGLGPDRLALQAMLRDRQRAGFLLALASKNREEDVASAFQRPEMVLRREDFVAWKVNWQPKSENLRALAAELNLGLESFVFLDDNPVECAEVAGRCPEVTVIPLPVEAEGALQMARQVWALDPAGVTATDQQRTELYRQQTERERWRTTTTSFRDFIEGLQLRIECLELSPALEERAAQLSQRTNQFNTTTVRRTASELRAWLAEPGQGVFLVRVADRFGDYGEVGLVAYRREGDALAAENFLLSCRVLGKGVEHRMVAELGRRAGQAGLAQILLPFHPTPRNEPAARFLGSLPATRSGDGHFVLPAEAAQHVRFDPDAQSSFPGAAASEPSSSSAATEATPERRRVDYAEIARLTQTLGTLRLALQRARMTARPASAPPYAAPLSGWEERLAKLWEEVLGMTPVGRHDHFLNLGGSSLQAAQFLARVHRLWGARISLSEFFADPQLSVLARRLAEQTDTSAAHTAAESNALLLPRAETTVLAPAQERMWFLDQFIPRRAAYNIVLGWRLRGTIDRPAWLAALRAVMQRHAPLRTAIQSEGPQRRVCVIENPEPSAEFLSAGTAAEAQKLLEEEAVRPFNLAQAPLLRTRVVSLGRDDHWCVFNVHHVAADGWSMGILLREWSEAYAACQQKGVPAWSPLRTSYADYAAWLNTPAVAQRWQADLAYWKQRLQGAPRLLELPTDLARPAVMTYAGAAVEDLLPPATAARLEQLAAAEGTTPFAILLAGFQALLHRYTGQTDLLIGTPVSGRNHPAVESLVGCFVNTIVLRQQVEAGTPFRQQVRATSQTVWEALAHDEIPFERLVDALKLERDLSHSPLFQVMLVLQNTPPGAPQSTQWTGTPIVVHNSGAKFDLVLEVTPRADRSGYGLVLEYNAGMFHRETMQRWLGHYVTLLTAACAQPDTTLGLLPLMGAAELDQIRKGFAAARQTYPEVDCLHRWFERQTAQTPAAMAVSCDGAVLTYDELNRRANRLAHLLLRAGVKPDTLVGLCVDRSLEMVVAVLAVLKAGGAYLPIDLSYPADRLAFMLEDAQAPVLLTQRSLLGALPTTHARTVLVDAEEPFWQTEPDTNPASPVQPEHLAYVIYTSGSTGKPKGCMITHRNVARLMLATDPWFHFGPQDVWTLFHSYAFDFSVWEIWGALLYGGRLVVVPYLVSRSPEAFYQLLASERVTVLNQTPSAFRQLIAAEESVGKKDLALRYVVFGGEALEMQSLRPWFERHGDQRPQLVNMYGITETTVHVTYRPLTRDDVAKASVIGVPIPDLEFHILDARRQPVPLGIPGEIYVGGGGVARGYLRREELTATRFVPHPLAADSAASARLYRTGDLARFLPGGDVEYLGRIDLQVKIRGFRIELGEIESVLCQHAAVREAVVLAREDSPGEKRLVAYLVLRPGASEPAPKDLREHLKQQVPDYMVPSAFVFLAQLPLTGNGKVDRSALPSPGVQRLVGGGLGAAPSTTLERAIAQICQESLRVENLGVEDNFFDLGAHSILLVGIHQRLRAELGLEFPLVTMFHFPTIRGLAQHLGTSTQPTPASSGSDALAERARRQREATRKMRPTRPS